MRITLSASGGNISLDLNLSAALSAAAEAVAADAKNLCPVDTGRLRNSIAARADGNQAEISANTDYAAFVEFGTSKAPAQPFLVPALLNGAGAAVSAAAAAIGDML